MKNRKILFLGGAFSQVPAIKYAKEQGYYVITVDYSPNNPGHRLADEYHNISTVNKYAILNLARNLKIDAISAYASDPSAPTAAYVSEVLNLVGSSFKSVELLSNKNLFRKFLRANNFKTPWFISGTELKTIKKRYNGEKAILKPIDSSGSKGIFLINNTCELERNFETALSYSNSARVILEQYIAHKGPQIHGEGFIMNGKVVFLLLGDQVFSKTNNLAPYSTLVPSISHKDIMPEVYGLIRSVIKKIGFQTGGINVEVIRDKNDNLYILEIGARNGGNFMPQLMKHATGFDLVKANIDALFNVDLNICLHENLNRYYAQIILHSEKDGIFHKINIPTEFSNNKLEENLYFKENDQINRYKDSKDVVGVLIIELISKHDIDVYKKSLLNWEWVLTH